MFNEFYFDINHWNSQTSEPSIREFIPHRISI